MLTTATLLLTLLGVGHAQDFITRGSNTGTNTTSTQHAIHTPHRPRMGTNHDRCPARYGSADPGMDQLGSRCRLSNHYRPQRSTHRLTLPCTTLHNTSTQAMQASVDVVCHPDRSATLVFQADDLVNTEFFKIPSDFFFNIDYQVFQRTTGCRTKCTILILISTAHPCVFHGRRRTHGCAALCTTCAHPHTSFLHSALSPRATPAASPKWTSLPTTP